MDCGIQIQYPTSILLSTLLEYLHVLTEVHLVIVRISFTKAKLEVYGIVKARERIIEHIIERVRRTYEKVACPK